MKSIDGIINPTSRDIKMLMVITDDKHDRELRKESAEGQKAIDDAVHDKHLIQIIDLAYKQLSDRGKAYLKNRIIKVRRGIEQNDNPNRRGR